MLARAFLSRKANFCVFSSFFFFYGGCPQVLKKADLTRFPRGRARKALPLGGFLLLTGWPFTKNVELHLVSSAFGLACFPRLRSGQAGAAPPPAAPPKLSARIRFSNERKNAKILKNFLLAQMAALVVLNLSRLKLSRTAIKKDDLMKLSTITIYKFFKTKTRSHACST